MPVEGHNLSTSLQQGWIPVDIGGGRVWDSTNTLGALLSTATVPAFNVISTGVGSTVTMPTINWSTGSVVMVAWPANVMPIDYSTVDGVTLNIAMSKSSNSDTACTFGVDFISNEGFSSVTSSKLDFTGPAVLRVNLAAANSPSSNSALAFRITPAAHATDQIRIHGLALQYTRKRRG